MNWRESFDKFSGLLKCAYQCHCLMRNKRDESKVILANVTHSLREQVAHKWLWDKLYVA